MAPGSLIGAPNEGWIARHDQEAARRPVDGHRQVQQLACGLRGHGNHPVAVHVGLVLDHRSP
jgi:hypothetical protein